MLCTDKDQEHVEFATAGLDDEVFVAKYLVALPDKKELEKFIKKEFKDSQKKISFDNASEKINRGCHAD